MVCAVDGELADQLHPESGGKWLLLKLATCHQWTDTGPTLFSVFINKSHDRIKCTLTKFANNTDLIGEVDTFEGRASPARRPGYNHRMVRVGKEELANRNLVEFN